MKKIKLLKLNLSLLLFLLAISYVSAQTNGTRPNIIVILADDLGYADVGFNRDGSFPSDLGAIPTPNIDALANNGIIATNAHVAHPFCGPSRAAIMTGMYPHKIGAQYNLPNNTTTDLGVPSDNYTNERVFFSKLIDDTNYNTAAFGKWHLGFEEGKYQPLDHGFDYFFGFLGGGKPYFESKYEDSFIRRTNNGQTVTNEYQDALWRNRGYIDENEFSDAPDEDYLTDILTDDTIDYISTNASSDPNSDPFFIYLAYNAPHTPLEAKVSEIALFKTNNPGFEDAYRNSPYITDSNQVLKEDPANRPAKIEEFVEDRMIYAAMVTNMDDNIGRIVTELKKDMSVFNNTVIIFLSDNGGYTHSKGAINYPLAALKGSVDEGGHKVPFFVHWPDKITTPSNFEFQISSLDLYPTLVNLAGGTIPASKTIDGVDFMDKMIAGQDARPGGVLHILRPQNGFHNTAVISHPYRMVRKGGNGSWRLYDANTSPEVQLTNANIATYFPGETRTVNEIIAELQTKGAQWSQEFLNIKPEWFDHERGDGHPHRIHWFGEDNNGNTGPVVFPGYESTYDYSASLEVDDAINKIFKIYPNPSSEKFNIKFDKTIKNLDIELISITGKTVKKIQLSNTNGSTIDATNLSSGVYVIKVKTDDNLTLEKVIKL